MFASAGIDYLDMPPCLRDVPVVSALAYDNTHYSASTNEIIAACLYRHLDKMLQDPTGNLN